MDFLIACECGEQFRVSEWSAGARLPCRCGRTVAVPSSMELRASAGLPEIDIPLKEQVLARLKSGELPPPDCLECGTGAAEVTPFVAECERAYKKKSADHHLSGMLVMAMSGAILGFMGMFLFRRTSVELLGRDTIIPVPAGLCPQCRGRLQPLVPLWLLSTLGLGLLIGAVVAFFLSGWQIAAGLLTGWLIVRITTAVLRWNSQQRIRQTLSSIPLYQRVFEKYPAAVVTITKLP